MAPRDTLGRVHEFIATIDPPRIPAYLVHPRFDTIRAMGTYYPTRHRKASNPFSRLIRKAKNGNRGSLGTVCLLQADYLARTIGTFQPIDLILHVPTDPRRRKERGFSIPEALAAAVSRRLCLPVSDCLVLTRPVRSLKGLRPEQRAAELIGAFALSNSALIKKKHILLIDDVLAYGTTAAEVARLLREKGAWGVSVVVLAYAAWT